MSEKPVAIIPARGGSKRIPRKNIKPFLGQPIIKYTIDAALNSKLFQRVIVSTDDQEIADMARSFGAEVPFMRSAQNSSDFATTSAVILEVLDELKKTDGEYETFCCLYPTAPFVTAEKIKETQNIFANENVDFVFPTTKFSYPPQRGLSIKNNRMRMVTLEHLNARSQDIEPIYHDVGQFYWGKVSSIRKYEALWVGDIYPYVIDDLECQDIDNLTDWKIAELKYELMKNE